jgi:hypothetical protein
MAYAVRKKEVTSDFTSRAAVGTSYDLAKYHALEVRGVSGVVGPSDFPYRFLEFESLFVALSSIAGGASTVTIRICSDVTGDQAVIAEATATIYAGLTTATLGSLSIHMLDYTAACAVGTNQTLYVFFKTDVGTVTVDGSILTTVA